MSPQTDRRAPLNGLVKFFDWSQPQQAEAVEVSVQGIFLKTMTPVAEDRMLTLQLQLPGETRPLAVIGRVVRTVKGNQSRPGGMDVRFVDLSATDRAVIEAYVQRKTMRAA